MRAPCAACLLRVRIEPRAASTRPGAAHPRPPPQPALLPPRPDRLLLVPTRRPTLRPAYHPRCEMARARAPRHAALLNQATGMETDRATSVCVMIERAHTGPGCRWVWVERHRPLGPRRCAEQAGESTEARGHPRQCLDACQPERDVARSAGPALVWLCSVASLDAVRVVCACKLQPSRDEGQQGREEA